VSGFVWCLSDILVNAGRVCLCLCMVFMLVVFVFGCEMGK